METTCDMMELCRLCLVKDEVNTPIFEEKGEIRQIFLKISSCLPVKVSREDKLPKKICDGCSCKLDMLYEFCNTSANAEKQLLTWLGQAGINANNTKTTDETMSAVVQMSNKPHETIVKQETIDTSDKEIEEGEETKHVSDPAYMFEQNFSFDDQASSSAGPSAHTNSDEPPPKRAKRAAALRALPITTETDEEDEDDVDAMEPLTKIEGESEESEGEDAEPSFVDAPSTSADDQPGPSGVGKGNIDAPNNFESIKLEKNFTCGVCFKCFKSEKLIKIHQSFHKPKIFGCKFCKNAFRSIRELNEHVTLCHEKSYRFYCSECSKGFMYAEPLRQHFLSEHGRNPFVLEDIADYETHMAKNAPIKTNYKCSVCPKEYVLKSTLTRHMKTHDEDYKSTITCHVCGKGMKRSNIKLHMRIHNDVKEYVCAYCGKEFSHRKNLTIHTRIHTKEKPYICKVCSKSFTQKSSLNVHMSIHTGAKPFKCDKCSKRYITGTLLKRHNCKSS